MPCEMCGKEAPLKRAVIEGTKMRVCPDCLEYGQEVEQPDPTPSPDPTPDAGSPPSRGSPGPSGSGGSGGASPDPYDDAEEMLAEDYGEIIRGAREERDLTVEELSNEINEKRSVVAKTERGDHHPRDELVGKLERFLDVELMVEVETSQRVSKSGSSSSGGVTLGDLIEEEMDDD